MEVHEYCVNVYSYKVFEIIQLVESSNNNLTYLLTMHLPKVMNIFYKRRPMRPLSTFCMYEVIRIFPT